MDKAIEIVLVVVVLFVTALIVVSMITGEADGFMDFMSGQTDNSQCQLWETQDPDERPDDASDRCDNIAYSPVKEPLEAAPV